MIRVRPGALVALLLAPLTACAGAPAAPLTAAAVACADGPVLMIVAGVTRDRARMKTYSDALAASGLYEAADGYYLNTPRPVAVFEGSPHPDFVSLIVRFPTFAAAEAFWRSPTYQTAIKPLREDPSAGDYTVTVYREAAPPAYMAGRVTPPRYRSRAGC